MEDFEHLTKRLWSKNRVAYHPEIAIALDASIRPLVGVVNPPYKWKLSDIIKADSDEPDSAAACGMVQIGFQLTRVNENPPHPDYKEHCDERVVIVTHQKNIDNAMMVRYARDVASLNEFYDDDTPDDRTWHYTSLLPNRGSFTIQASNKRPVVYVVGDIHRFLLTGQFPDQ